MVSVAALVLACGQPEQEPEDRFGNAETVRISSPVSGETVESTFTVAYTAGRDVVTAAIRVDGAPVVEGIDAVHDREVDVTAESGRHVVEIVGYGAAGRELSRDDVDVRVVSDPSLSWVTITSPTDGSHPTNPVQFVVDASSDVVSIEIFADGWSLGTTAPGDVLTYEFAGVGFSRAIDAYGYDADGNQVAADAIDMTVEAGSEPPPADFNELVMALIPTYPTDGTITYWWPEGVDWSGSTRDVWYQGGLVADDGGVSNCFCVGLTWEVYFRAWQEWDQANGGTGDDLNGISYGDAIDMRTDWYVREVDGDGPSIAMENYGVGVEVVSFDDWRPGDFVQFWRLNGSGHNVIFAGWITDADGDRIGMDYWSCNGSSSTDGPGYNDEYFGTHSSAMDPDLMWAGRGLMPADWT